MEAITVGSLFSGIGGIDLGLERAGMRVIWQSEIDSYASRILAEHWPGIPNLGDVTQVNWKSVERPDMLCGGFPCQPVSVAGRRKAQEDARWLWPEYARAIRELRPRWVFAENVPGLLTIACGGAAQAVFGTLSELGYDAEWASVPATAFGAPQLRYRVVIVAYPNNVGRVLGSGWWGQPADGRDDVAEPQCLGWHGFAHAATRNVSDWNEAGRIESHGRSEQRCEALADPRGSGLEVLILQSSQHECSATERGSGRGEGWPTQPKLGRATNGFPDRVDGCSTRWPARPGEAQHAWEPPRVAVGILNRASRLRVLGNAVVPQMAEWIGHQIVAADTREKVTVSAK